jgi:hypothetical protein
MVGCRGVSEEGTDNVECLLGVEGDADAVVLPFWFIVCLGGVFCVEEGRAGQANLMQDLRGGS